MSDELLQLLRAGMSDGDTPKRRSADRDRWTDDRLDMFERMVMPAVGIVATHTAQLDAFTQAMEMHRDLLRERLDSQDKMLLRIHEATRTTNGSVAAANLAIAALERENAREAGEREALARRLAARAWIKPSVAGVVASVFGVLLGKLLGVI